MERNFAGNVGTGGHPAIAGGAIDVPDPLLTDKEVCSQLSCARSTLWRWVAEGTIPRPLKIGGTSRWRQSTVTRVVDEAEAEAYAA